MDRDKLIDYLCTTPFKPIRIRVTDGRVFDVHFPEYVKLGPWGVHIIIPRPGRPRYSFQTFHQFRLEDLVSVESMDTATAA